MHTRSYQNSLFHHFTHLASDIQLPRGPTTQFPLNTDTDDLLTPRDAPWWHPLCGLRHNSEQNKEGGQASLSIWKWKESVHF